jgi:hypothetical protein
MQPMSEADDDPITRNPEGAPRTLRTILLLPDSVDGLVVTDVRRTAGWVGECSAREADALCSQCLAVTLPDDWPALPPPAADGEPLPDYIERAVFGYPAVVALTRMGTAIGVEGSMPMPMPSPLRPGERTMKWWRLEYPPGHRPLLLEEKHYRTTTWYHYHRYLISRLMVQLFDQLRDGAWVVFGRQAGGTDYALQPVAPRLWRHPDMLLNYRARGDWLRPDQRNGWPPPAADLPAFGDLILHGPPTSTPKESAETMLQVHGPSSSLKDVRRKSVPKSAEHESHRTIRGQVGPNLIKQGRPQKKTGVI